MRPKTLTNTKTKVNHQNCTNKHAPPRATHPLDARNHYPITKHHTPPPRRGDNTGVASGPNSVPAALLLSRRNCCCAPSPHPLRATGSSRPTPSGVKVFFVVLLRKEVIQPHLPVRLPCYDFVPIADPTFDSSPHKG